MFRLVLSCVLFILFSQVIGEYPSRIGSRRSPISNLVYHHLYSVFNNSKHPTYVGFYQSLFFLLATWSYETELINLFCFRTSCSRTVDTELACLEKAGADEDYVPSNDLPKRSKRTGNGGKMKGHVIKKYKRVTKKDKAHEVRLLFILFFPFHYTLVLMPCEISCFNRQQIPLIFCYKNGQSILLLGCYFNLYQRIFWFLI